ncbi:kama family protein, partial [Lophiostoma macrostomum CBS 122681]
RYWKNIPRWEDVPCSVFNTYEWQKKNSIVTKVQLKNFFEETLPDTLEPSKNPRFAHIRTREQFVEDALNGLGMAPMSVRITPHLLALVDWKRALDDPIRTQFVPLQSGFIGDHPKLTLDSLHESEDSQVQGLVHRYSDKALFLATSICPVYCRFCTRSYSVGAPTDTVTKVPNKPIRKRWEAMFNYIESTPAIQDIVVSGGDTYYLEPEQIQEIECRLLGIENVRRIRFASKGLAVLPSRTLDATDSWTKTFIELTKKGRKLGKQVCLHTHFNHPTEITWVTKKAAQYLFQEGVIVRNQTVLLKGVNDNVETMAKLIRLLADMNIQPASLLPSYYVYQCDLVRGIEDLRTPLSVILDLEEQLRGTIAGFMMPSFVVDLPGGGGKRLAATGSYDPKTGVSTFTAPGLPGEKGKRVYEYYDPKP